MNRSLEDLFEIAQQYGNINVYQCDRDRTFCTSITFMTIDHAELKATSGFRHKTIRAALIKAIEKAEEIIGSLKDTVDKEYKLLT